MLKWKGYEKERHGPNLRCYLGIYLEALRRNTEAPSLFFFILLTVHLDYLCNKNQLDALFILSILCQSTPTCFGHICSPSLGGILYIYNTYQLLYIYSIPPNEGLQICPKHVEGD